MHSFEANDTIFHFNSDLNGSVIINSRTKEGGGCIVPGKDLLQFLGYILQRKRIEPDYEIKEVKSEWCGIDKREVCIFTMDLNEIH